MNRPQTSLRARVPVIKPTPRLRSEQRPINRSEIASIVISWGAVMAMALLLFVLAWGGIRGALAAVHLDQARSSASDLPSAIGSDSADALRILEAVSLHTESAHALTSDPVWKLASSAPWVGPQLDAVGTLISSADEVVRLGALPLVEATQGDALDALRPVSGRIDTVALARLREPASEAAARADAALLNVEHLDRTPLVGKISDAVKQAQEMLSQSAGALDAVSTATQLLPDMLGQSGQRSYLVLVQNNAEFRSLGGIAGTALLLRTDSGSVSLSGATPGTVLSTGIAAPVATLPDDVRSVYGTQPALFFQNLTQVPDFTFDGPLAQAMYAQRTGVDVDGVISVDPVALGYIIQSVGPVALPDGTSLTGSNAASVLLNGIYRKYPDYASQDAFFAAAAGTVFDTLLSGRGTLTETLASIARGADERRILIWSAHPEEQAKITGTTIAGELELKLKSTAPIDAATSLPRLLTGGGVFGVPPGQIVTVANIYIPEGFEVTTNDSPAASSAEQHDVFGRRVITYGLRLDPQTSTEVRVIVTAETRARVAEALVTPTSDASVPTTVSAVCDYAPSPGLE